MCLEDPGLRLLLAGLMSREERDGNACGII
jgi:hypothetical protein